MAFFDSYKNIERGGITKESKTATKEAVLTAYANPKSRPHAIQIVKALLDFKAHQANDASAERLLGNLANHIKVCNQAKGPGVEELTERSLHELVKNRSAIFKKDLPDTFKDLLRRMLFNTDAKSALVDSNTARILRSNGLIDDADVQAATRVRRVAEQILPGELAAFFNRSTNLYVGRLGRTGGWSLAGFLLQCCKDYPRAQPTPTDAEWESLAHLVGQVSHGRLGSRHNAEFQRVGQEVSGRTAAAFRRNILSADYTPSRQNAVSMAESFDRGGHDRNYREFLMQAGTMHEVRRRTDLREAVEKMQDRERILSDARRISQHLPSDVVWRGGARWEGSSNPQHQQWLELQRLVRADVVERSRKATAAEDGTTTRAILMCGGRNQMVRRLLDKTRGNDRELVGDEAALASRVARCLGPSMNPDTEPGASALVLLCEGKATGFRDGSLPRSFQGSTGDYDFPERLVTTNVDAAARTLSQVLLLHIRIPGCQPVEDFYLYQERTTQFHWDVQTNFISAAVVDFKDWACSTKEPQFVSYTPGQNLGPAAARSSF